MENNEIDVAIALTDPLIAGIAKGSPFSLVGTYVTSPLNWAVITSPTSKFNEITDLRHTTIGISRIGSGSQTMALVMALQQGWDPDDIKFKVCNDIHGLVAAVNDGSISAFMWEWFTTKPWKDRGEVKFIGSVPTPWHSWMIAAHNDESRAPQTDVSAFLRNLSLYVKQFDSPEKREKDDVDYIHRNFGYEVEDIKAWLDTVKYPQDVSYILEESIERTINILVTASVLPKTQTDGQEWNASNFIGTQ